MFLFFFIKLTYLFHICICSKVKLCIWKSLTRSGWEIESLDSEGFIQPTPWSPSFVQDTVLSAKLGHKGQQEAVPALREPPARPGRGPTRTSKQTEISQGGCTADVPVTITARKSISPQKQSPPSV